MARGHARKAEAADAWGGGGVGLRHDAKEGLNPLLKNDQRTKKRKKNSDDTKNTKFSRHMFCTFIQGINTPAQTLIHRSNIAGQPFR